MLGTLASAVVVDAETLIERLKADVFRGRLRLREFFKDFDPLRAGVVTEAKFRTALDESGLRLADPELTTLSAKVCTYGRDGLWPSDHFPVLAVFSLAGAEEG